MAELVNSIDDEANIPVPPLETSTYIRGLMPDNVAVREFLTGHQWPKGLQEVLIKSLRRSPSRYFIIDDSESMSIHDGRLLEPSDGTYRVTETTRWKELCKSIRFHLNLIIASGSQAEFRFLNGPALHVSPEHPEHAAIIERVLNKGPAGGTPLCVNIRAIVDQIRRDESELKAKGQKAVVVIATDGMSSDGDIAEALKSLESLPCSVIVRLCTGDPEIVTFWNNVDSALEVQVDVLDDFESEAQEVNQLNPWLTYGEALHRAREFGVLLKEFDLIDERPLEPPVQRIIAINTLGSGADGEEFPHPDSSEAYASFVRKRASEEPMTFDVITGAMRPWLV